MHTIFKVFWPTAPAGRTPRGPCSNTAPSSLRMEVNQPPHLPDSSSSTIYNTVVTCVLNFMLNVTMKADLLNQIITLKAALAAMTIIASSRITSGLGPQATRVVEVEKFSNEEHVLPVIFYPTVQMFGVSEISFIFQRINVYSASMQ